MIEGGSPYAAFMEYHRMIMLHKKSKIKAMFHHLSEQEIEGLMIECGHNEVGTGEVKKNFDAT